jgi:DNA-directed RNA polymerase alpha subunit
MGLFSGVTDFVSNVFGGSGGSSSTSANIGDVKVSDLGNTEINFNLDKLAEALENQAKTEQKTAYEVAQFKAETEAQNKAKEQILKSAEINKDLAVKSAELQQNEIIFNYVKSFVFLGTLGFIYYKYKKGKK